MTFSKNALDWDSEQREPVDVDNQIDQIGECLPLQRSQPKITKLSESLRFISSVFGAEMI